MGILRRRKRAFMAAAAVTAFSLLSGGMAWAYWTTSANATGSVQTKTVSVTQTNFGSLGSLYENHDLTSTGSFTITNTGTTNGNAAVGISTSPGGLAASLPVRVWSVTSAAACTDTTTLPSSAESGTWASFSLNGGVTLNAGSSVTYCVRTTAASRQSIATALTGAQSSTATLTVTLDDNDGWDGTRTATATTIHTTRLIYPTPVANSTNYISTGNSNWFQIKRAAPQTICLDVSDNGAVGAAAIAWTCHSNPNQRWEILPATDAGSNLVRIRPKHVSGLGARLAVNGSNQATIATLNTSSAAQLWEFQRISDTTFQLVSHTSGFCLNMGATQQDVALTISACATTTAGRANQTLTLVREPLVLSTTGTGAGSNVVFGFSGADTGVSSYRIQQNVSGAWQDRGTATGTNATSVLMTRATVPTGTSQWRIIINGTNNVIYDGITLNRTGSGNSTVITATAGIN